MQNLEAENLNVTMTTKGALPRVPFALLKREILGPKYELSIVVANLSHMKKISHQYKGNASHTNVLSFPLSKNSGEIFICPSEIKKEAPRFGHDFQKHLIFIVIHGMLHLAGYTHGSKMESAEKRLLAKFF